MSQENLEVVRGIYADERGLIDATAVKVAEDAEFDFSALYPDTPILRGIDALRRFIDSGPWVGSLHFEPERFLDVDDERVLVFVRVSATGTGSGVPVENRSAHEVTVRGGLVARVRMFGDRAEALEAVGLTKQDTHAESSS